MKHQLLVSIIINNYNYENFLAEAIDSALNQTYPHTEVIVVDDGSTDNSHKIIDSYGARIVPVLKENGGQASAFNAGLAASKGNIICFLDADDVFANNKVEDIVHVFDSYSEIGWCFHSLKLTDKNTGSSLGFSRESSSRQCDFRANMRRGKLPFFPPPTSGLCLKRSLLAQILPVPETFIKTSADRYVRAAALALSKGFFLDKPLTIQGIHERNAATLRNTKQSLGKRNIVIAHLLRIKFPELTKFTNHLFARGLGAYWQAEKIEIEYEQYIKNYLSDVSVIEKIEIGLMALYQSRPWKKPSVPRIQEATSR